MYNFVEGNWEEDLTKEKGWIKGRETWDLPSLTNIAEMSITSSSGIGTGSSCSSALTSVSSNIGCARKVQLVGSKVKKRIKISYITSSSSEEENRSSFGAFSESSGIDLSDSASTSELEEVYKSAGQRRRSKSPIMRRRRVSYKEEEEEEMETDSQATDSDEFYVQEILDVSVDKKTKKRQFFVKWLNYDSDDNTWEPEENFDNCRGMVDQFMAKRNGSKPQGKKRQPKGKVAARKATSGRQSKTKCEPKRLKKPDEPEEPEEPADANETAQVVEFQDDAERIVQINFIFEPTENCTHSPGEALDAWLNDVINLGLNHRPRPVHECYVKIMVDDHVDWARFNLFEAQTNPDEIYRCVVTEDLTGKQPKFIYGATTDVFGEVFCLVEFEGENYVELIPPDNLFAKFPSFRPYFEMHCPNHFSQTVG